MSREMLQLAELLTKHQSEIYNRDKRIAELEQAIDQLEYVGLECIEYVGIANYPCRQAEARARLRLKAVKLKENCNE